MQHQDKLKLGREWVFQMDNDPKHTSKVVTKWLNLNIFPTYCGKFVEGYPERLTQVKQFKGNATKYN